MKNLDWKKILSQLARLVISIVLIVWLVKSVDFRQLIRSMQGANWGYILLAMVLANLDRLLMAYKWELLLRAKGLRLPMSSVVGTYYKASFLGSLFLPTVGADALRVYEVTRQTRRSEDVISSVVLERFLGIVAVFMVGVVGFLLFIQNVDGQGWMNLVRLSLALVVAIGVFFISLRFNWLARIAERPPFSRWKIVRPLHKILVSYQDYANHQQTLVIFFLLSIVEQFEPIFSAYLVARAFHLDIPFITFVMFIPVIMIVIRLPISFDGFGVREGLFVYLFGLVGVSQANAFLIGFIASIIARFAVAPLTLYYFLVKKETLPPIELEVQPITSEE